MESSFAELFDDYLTMENVSARSLEEWIGGIPKADRNAPSSRQSIGDYRSGRKLPKPPAWRVMVKALELKGKTVPESLSLKLHQEWQAKGVPFDALRLGTTNPQIGGTHSSELFTTIQEALTKAKAEKDPEQTERLLCLLEADIEHLNRIISIRDGESGYFEKWLKVAKQVPREVVLAYIRPFQARSAPEFEGFYDEVEELVHAERLELSYVFLEHPKSSEESEKAEPGFQPTERFTRVEQFAKEIRTVSAEQFAIGSTCLRPSFVIFTQQKIVFTHERDDAQRVVDAQEWHSTEAFQHYMERYAKIRRTSHIYKSPTKPTSPTNKG